MGSRGSSVEDDIVRMLIALAMGLLAVCVQRYRLGSSLSPDGAYYMTVTCGRETPAPYCNRWFLPYAIGPHQKVWELVTLVVWLLCAPFILLLTDSVVAVWLWVWLPMGAQWLRHPVLVDAPAMLFALAAAVSYRSDLPVLAFGLALLSSACKESGALFAACFAGEPWLVLPGLGAAVFMRGLAKRQAISTWWPKWLSDPIGEARKTQDILNWKRMLLPWGAMLPLCIIYASTAHFGIWVWVALALGYAQLLVAQDKARLYQWAAPALVGPAAMALEALPAWASAACIFLHPFICATSREARKS
jgi:hypothetical protein